MSRLPSFRLFCFSIFLIVGLAACGGDDKPSSDTTPDAFTFTSQDDVALSTTVASSSVTITGINAAAPVSVSNGEYSIEGGSFTSAEGSVTSGQTLVLRGVSSDAFATDSVVTITVGDVNASFTISTLAADTSPDNFSFTALTDQALATQLSSNAMTVSGINTTTPISVSNGSYAIDGGAFTSEAGTVEAGQSVFVQGTSSVEFETAVVVTLTVGDVSGDFTMTTFAEDTTPESFSFEPQTDVNRVSDITSNTITVAGINSPAAISIEGGSYIINDGEPTSEAGTVNNGDQVSVQLTAASSALTLREATLTIGGESASFSARTLLAFDGADDVEPGTENVESPSTITLADFDSDQSMSVDGGEYQINDSAFTADAGTVSNGQTVTVRGDASPDVATDTTVTVTIGGFVGTYVISTRADSTSPEAEIAFPPPVSMTEGDAVTVRGTAEDAESEIVAVRVNGELATDTSDDGSFSTWRISSALGAGDNNLTVEVEDSAGNINASAASVMVRSDATLSDFPDGNNPLSLPQSIAVDYARDRMIIGDREIATLIAVDLLTGERTPFSDNTGILLPINFAESLLVDEADDRVFMPNGVDNFIYEIDLETGTRSIISSNTEPTGTPTWNSPTEIIFHPTKSDALLFFDVSAITEMSLIDGSRSTFSSGGEGDHEPTPDLVNDFSNTRGGVYYEVIDSILSADDIPKQRILAVAMSNGARTIFSDNTTPNADAPLFVDPRTMAMDSAHDRILVNDAGFDGVIAVGLSGDQQGVRSVFSSATIPDTLNAPVEAEEIFYNGVLGYALLLDTTLDAVLAIDIESGERVFYTRGDSPE